MRHSISISLCLAAGLLPASVLGAEDALTFEELNQAHTDEIIRVLSGSDDALALLLAAKMAAIRDFPNPHGGTSQRRDSLPQRDLLVRRARAAGTDDPLVLSSLAMDCPASPPACDAPAARERLRAIDPDNALVWIMDLPDASDDRFDAALLRVASAQRFDMRWLERTRRYAALLTPIEPSAQLLAAVPDDFGIAATAEDFNMVMAVGMSMAEAAPPLQGIARPCRAAAELAATPRRDACHTLAAMLATESDNLLSALLGARLWQALATTDIDRAAATTTARELAWLQESTGELQADAGPHFVSEVLERYREPDATELSVMRDRLREEGIALDPPATWLPASEQRSKDAAAK